MSTVKGGTQPTDPRVLDRFWAKVEKTETCWNWMAGSSRGHAGLEYGRITVNGRTAMAHRFAYEVIVGPIPEGFHIDHLCRNTKCVNPAHLEAVTPAENNRRSLSPTSANLRKTHCSSGHQFTTVNTYIRTNGNRACRACRTIWNTKRNKHRYSRPITLVGEQL